MAISISNLEECQPGRGRLDDRTYADEKNHENESAEEKHQSSER